MYSVFEVSTNIGLFVNVISFFSIKRVVASLKLKVYISDMV